MRTTRIGGGLWLLAAIVAFGLLAAACSNGTASAAAGSGTWVKIDSPAANARVSEPFTVKLSASVPIGDPSTGDDHVHLCFDGASCDTKYQLAYSNSVTVSGLAPGTHTMEASLRNADHSAAGPTDTVTFTVGAAGGAGSSAPSTTGGGMTGGSGY